MKTLYRKLGATLVLSACLTPALLMGKVKSQTAKGANLKQYKTYQWAPPKVLTKMGLVENHPINSVLAEFVDAQLAARGLSRVLEGGDLTLQSWVLTESIPQVQEMIYATGSGTFYGPTIAIVGRYNREGTLVVNLIDQKTKKFAWIAMATENLSNGTLEDREIRKKVDKATKDMFKKYPVKPAKK
jgi:hypothetical protein